MEANENGITGKMAEKNEDLEEEDDMAKPLEAATIFVLMSQRFRLSRNARAQWYINHLRGELRVNKYEDLSNFVSDLEAVAVVPEHPPDDWDYDVSHLYCYSVSPRSMVHFLSQTYCFAFLLDLSPSASQPDLLNEGTLVSSVIPALRTSLTNLVRPFYVPGSQLLLRPDIYVTVIAWTPFIAEGAQAVLCQGCLVTPDNVEFILSKIVKKLTIMEQRSFEVSCEVNSVMSEMRSEAERLTYGLFEEITPKPQICNIATTTADSGFIAMIRTGVLALQLLPRNSSLKIVVVTDGMIAAPDINSLDNLLSQLRKDTIALSFIKLSSLFHPQSGLARVPYEELMEYMALSTYGAYLPMAKEVPFREYVYDMNIYHEAFLCWSFKKALQGIDISAESSALGMFGGGSLLNLSDQHLEELASTPRGRFSGIKNNHFALTETRFTRKKYEAIIHSSLTSLLSVRLREGYTVNSVKVLEDKMEVKLSLPWKINSFIHYTVQATWPLPQGPQQKPSCRIQVHLEGVYDTMHDLICKNDEESFTSHVRNSVVQKFHNTLQHLNYVDRLLVHFECFSANSQHYILPDVLTTGVPVFHIPPYPATATPELYIQDFPNTAFLSYWKPISSLEMDIWHRWLHAHRIHILLNNDYPLPKHLLLPNTSGRYFAVQCRKAAVQLSDCLKRFSTFVLLENSTYIKFMYDNKDDKNVPTTFYIIRMTSKPPCVIIWLAFPGGTSGRFRNRIVQEVRSLISKLTIKQLQSWKDPNHCHLHGNQGILSASGELSESPACILFKKPVERILIRYDQQPSDFLNILEPAFTSLTNSQSQSQKMLARRIVNIFGGIIHERPSSGTYLTLSRYLHHRRWIWKTKQALLQNASMARILSILSRIRQINGFYFAHSKNGIQTMMMELPIDMDQVQDQSGDHPVSCVVQYVLFPPYSSSGSSTYSMNGEASDEDELELQSNTNAADDDESVQIITEVWVEPQDGLIKQEGHNWSLAKGLTFEQIPEIVFAKDNEVISCLLTCEHLSLMCQDKDKQNVSADEIKDEIKVKANHSAKVTIIPVQWNLSLVLSKSQPVELLFPMLIQNLASDSCQNQGNEELFKEILEKVAKLHDREITLIDNDHAEFQKFLNTTNEQRTMKIPIMHSRSRRSSRSASSAFDTNAGAAGRNIKFACFVKAISMTRSLVTMMPSSFADLKAMLVDESALSGLNPNAVQVVQKPIVPVPCSMKNRLIITPDIDIIGYGDLLTSNHSSMNNLDQDSSAGDFRAKSGSISKLRKKSTTSVPPVNEFRKRVFSSDSGQAERNRAKSMEVCEKESSSSGIIPMTSTPRGANLLRPRTQTHSQIHRLKQLDSRKKSGAATSACSSSMATTKKSSKKIWGSVTLPIFAFDVLTTDVTAYLVHENHPQFKRHQWASVKIANNMSDNQTADKKIVVESETVTESNEKKEPLAELEKSLRLHCINLQFIYFRSFVTAVFKSLQLRHPLHSFDVQAAIDNCEESIQEIHFTDFLLKTCNHIQQGLKLTQQDSSSGVKNKTSLPIEDLIIQRTCSDFDNNHSVIKKKFHDVLTNTFQLVPHSLDLYFYCPASTMTSNLGDDLYPVPSRMRRDTKETCGTGSSILDAEEDLVIKMKMMAEEDEDNLEVNSKKFAAASSLSLISNACSDQTDDLNESKDDFVDFSPLFLQVSISIRHGKETMVSAPISQLPTCLIDLVKSMNANDGGVKELDLSKLSVSLDLLSITLPLDTTIQPLGTRRKMDLALDRMRSVSMCSNLSFNQNEDYDRASDITENINVDGFNDDSAAASGLSPNQEEALKSVISDIKWMISDEIAYALTTHTLQITETTLKTVADHIRNSNGKPGCSTQTIPLQYVFGAELSHKLFLDSFNQFKIKGWKKVEVGKYCYFLHDDDHDDIITADHDEILEIPGSRKIQLSPVKESRYSIGSPLSLIEAASAHSEAESEVFVWCENPSLQNRSKRPQFWLIVSISEVSGAEIFFQYREGQFEALLPWRQTQQLIANEIRNFAHKTNQALLLNDLFETKICNRLLEPESNEEAWTISENMNDYLEANLNVSLKPGLFACPLVWETDIPLHPRLREQLSQGVSNQGSRGFLAVKMALNNFAVTNRKNMFAYRDDREVTFYFKIYEVIANTFCKNYEVECISRSSSMSMSSSAMLYDFDRDQRPEDRIELKVFGIQPVGPDIEENCMKFLNARLNEKVVEIMSTVLQRNPMCKLMPEDVLFLQKHNSSPDEVLRFRVNPGVAPFLEALQYYLRQNIVHQLAIVPKYHSRRVFFKDNVDGIDVPSADIFLFNKVSGSRRGLACISMTFVDGHGVALHSNKAKTVASSNGFNDLSKLIEIDQITSESTCALDEDCIILQFRIWEQGRIDIEEMAEKLKAIAAHALWEVVMEFSVLPNDIVTSKVFPGLGEEPLSCLDEDFANFAKKWLDVGLAMNGGLASLAFIEASIDAHQNSLNTLKELIHQVNLAVSDVTLKAFQQGRQDCYVPCNRSHGYVPIYAESSGLSLLDNYTVIGRNFKHWKSCNEGLKAEGKAASDDLAPKEMRPLQRFQPLVVKNDADQIKAFIPRQRLLLAFVSPKKVSLYSYNCSRDVVDRLSKQVSNLGHWINARSSLAMSIVASKMGLYHNLAFYRGKSKKKGHNVFRGQDYLIEPLVKNSSPPTLNSKNEPNLRPVEPSDPNKGRILDAYLFDAKPLKKLQNCAYSIERDVTSRQGRQLLEYLTYSEKDLKAKAKKLFWEDDKQTNHDLMKHEDLVQLQQLSHCVAFCYTPLLFLPRWRYDAHSTRLRINMMGEVTNEPHFLPSTRGAEKKKLRSNPAEEREHTATVSLYLLDYVKYLQSLGFSRIKPIDKAKKASDKEDPKREKKRGTFFSSRSSSSRSSTKIKLRPGEDLDEATTSIYVKRSANNGLQLFELGVCEPFVYFKMYVLEAYRVVPQMSRGYSSTMGKSSLTREMAEAQKMLHLHSFSFDHHLRTIRDLAAGKQTLRKGFHVVHFLEDFMMYYSKGPNYARNSMHAGSITIPCTQEWIKPDQLYNYVLSHESTYQFRVLRMEPLYMDANSSEFDNEYALVRHTRCQLSFKFPDQFRKTTDDVDVTLVISLDREPPTEAENYLKLKYIIIICRKDMYPTAYVNAQFSGIFRSVSGVTSADVMEVKPGLDLDKMLQVTASNSNDICKEPVDYVGYFSTHEQSMEAVIRLQASMTEAELASVFRKASVHCRRDQLWKSLHDGECSVVDFAELLAFVHCEQLTKLNEVATLIRGRTLGWFRSLTSLLASKYEAKNRVRTMATPNVVEHFVLLSEDYIDMATVITLDLRRGSADITVINRYADIGPNLPAVKLATYEIAAAILNDICYHLWTDQHSAK